MAETSKVKEAELSENEGNSLLLYHFPRSFYSQKVVFALHEKQLKFQTQVVNIIQGEQFEPWFMKLNPKAQVPVLKDGVRIIPDSNRIIDYLEDNFSNGNTPRLKPEKGSTSYQTMETFQNKLEKVRLEIITFGCIFNPELTTGIKLSPQELKARSGRYDAHLTLLDECITKNPELKTHYLAKKEDLKKSHTAAQNVEEVKKALTELDDVLEAVDKHLEAAAKEGNGSNFICGDIFTIPDIVLSIILNRLQLLGLMDHYFGNSKNLHVYKYFKCIQQRDAYRKAVSQKVGILGTLCCMGNKERLAVSLGSAMVVLGVAGLAVFLVQRKK